MSVNVIGTLKPKNNGSFPIVEAVDVLVSEGLRLPDALTAKADASAMSESVTNIQGQINQIEISSSAEAIVAPEVAGARVGMTGTEYSTLKERLDADATAARGDSIVMSLYDLPIGVQDEDGTIHKDIISSAVFKNNATLSQASFIESTMYDYLSNTTSSSTAKISNPIRVRNFDGTLISEVECTYAESLQSANIGFGFKKDGSHDIKYNAKNVVNGKIVFSNETYYFVILKYTTVDLAMTCDIGKVIVDSFAKKLGFPSLADIDSMTVTAENALKRDVIDFMSYTPNATLSMNNFYTSTIYNYKTKLTSSETAKVVDVVRVRNEDGSMITPIHCEYGSNIDQANICFGYKKDGTHDRAYKAADVSNGILVLDSTTYFILILKYSTVELSIYTIYGSLVVGEADAGMDLSIPSLANIESMTVASGGVLKRDIIDFMPYTANSTLTAANFSASNIHDYKTHLTASTTARIVDVVRVRNEDGTMITPIHCEYGSNIRLANICFGYNKNGTPDRVYKAQDVVNGILTLDATTYFILILKYSTVDLTLYTLYGKLTLGSSVPHYSVGAGSGMDFSSFTSCIRALAADSSEKVIDIYGGEYDVLEEMGGSAFLETLTGTEHWYDVCDIVPANTTIQGHGNVRIVMELPSDTPTAVATLLSPVNIRGNTTIKNVSIVGKNCRYAIHPEGSKEPQFDNAIWSIEDCYIEKTEDDGVSVTGVCFSCGLNDGVQFTISRTNIVTNLQSGFSMHDNGDQFDVSPRVSIDSCAIVCTTYPLVYSCTYRQNMETVINVRVSNTYLGNGYVRKRTSNETAKDCYRCVYVNSPHRTQHGANVTDIIEDVNYNAFAQ